MVSEPVLPGCDGEGCASEEARETAADTIRASWVSLLKQEAGWLKEEYLLSRNQASKARSLACISRRQAPGSASAAKRKPLAGPGLSPKLTGSQPSSMGKAKSAM